MTDQVITQTLVEFFVEAFAEDPVGVGDWLAQGGQDVDQFLKDLEQFRIDKRVK